MPSLAAAAVVDGCGHNGRAAILRLACALVRAGLPGSGPGQRNDLSERLAAANRLLQETRIRRQSVEREIATLRGRISRIEKALEEAWSK